MNPFGLFIVAIGLLLVYFGAQGAGLIGGSSKTPASSSSASSSGASQTPPLPSSGTGGNAFAGAPGGGIGSGL